MIEMTRTESERLLCTAPIGRLAMAGPDGVPYVIPLPFCWHRGTVYLRLPLTGRKGRVLSVNDWVCFEVDWFTEDLSDYGSVLVEGRLVAVNDLEERQRVKAANEEKYRKLRGASRLGHGRKTPVEELPLKKMLVSSLSGRMRDRTPAPMRASVGAG